MIFLNLEMQLPKSFNMKIKSFLRSIDQTAIIAYTDAFGTITYVNDNFCEISGYSSEELLGQNHRIVNSGHHPKAFWEKMWKTIQSGKAWHGDVCNKTKNGEVYWVKTSVTPDLDDEGNILGFFAIRFEITRQKILEKQNEDLMTMNQAVQEIAKVGGWELDLESENVIWTDQTYKIHEVPVGFKIKKELAIEFYVEEDRSRIEDCINNCLKHGTSWDDYFQIITTKGRKLWVRAAGEAVFDRHGKVKKLRGTFQDVNNVKESELKAEQERKMFLHSAKLSTLGEMASSMIHEISNPLTVISGVLNSAKRRESLEDVRTLLDKADPPMERLLKMVQNLRKYSRNETVNREIKLNNLTQIILTSEEYTRYKFRRGHTEFRLLNKEPLMVNCEASEMEQVFVNLFNNAVDAVENLQDRWVEVDHFIDPVQGVTVTVTDSGSGIPKEIAENIFNSFYTTKEKGKGTGIGLGVVSDIMQEHGAKIKVDHSKEHTCFVINFPDPDIEEVG
jgi:PAS domain S-box-containing protein